MVLVIEYTSQNARKLFQFRGTKAEVLMIEPNNEYLDLEMFSFEIQPFSKQKVTIKCVPRKIGTFRILAFFYKVFNIPRFYIVDEDFDCSEQFKTFMYTNTTKAIADQYSAKSSEAQTQTESINMSRDNRMSAQLNRISEIQMRNYFKAKHKQGYEPSTLNCTLNRLLRQPGYRRHQSQSDFPN